MSGRRTSYTKHFGGVSAVEMKSMPDAKLALPNTFNRYGSILNTSNALIRLSNFLRVLSVSDLSISASESSRTDTE